MLYKPLAIIAIVFQFPTIIYGNLPFRLVYIDFFCTSNDMYFDGLVLHNLQDNTNTIHTLPSTFYNDTHQYIYIGLL